MVRANPQIPQISQKDKAKKAQKAQNESKRSLVGSIVSQRFSFEPFVLFRG